jgi:ATP-binding cassette subfamily B protein
MDGFEVLERIRSDDSAAARSLVTVALTAYASNEYRARSLAAGFDIHFAKPFNTETLANAVADALERAGGVVSDGTAQTS